MHIPWFFLNTTDPPSRTFSLSREGQVRTVRRFLIILTKTTQFNFNISSISRKHISKISATNPLLEAEAFLQLQLRAILRLRPIQFLPPIMDRPSAENENITRNWRSQNFRDGMTSQIQQAIVHCGTVSNPTNNNARDLETRAYSRSSTKSEYMDFVGQVIIRLNVVNNNRAIEGPKESAVYEIHDEEDGSQVIPSGFRKKPIRGMDRGARKQGVNSIQATVVHEMDLSSSDQPTEMKAPGEGGNNAREERAGAGVASETSKDGTEIKINRKRPKSDCDDDDVRQYLLRLIRDDEEKQIKELTDYYKDDLENEEFKEKKRAVEKFMEECVAKTKRPPSYLCDQWSHEIFKDPVVTPSGFTYERRGIENHLRNVGEYDPITHVKLTADLLIPNHAMRQVVHAYMAASTKAASPARECSSPKRLRESE